MILDLDEFEDFDDFEGGRRRAISLVNQSLPYMQGLVASMQAYRRNAMVGISNHTRCDITVVLRLSAIDTVVMTTTFGSYHPLPM